MEEVAITVHIPRTLRDAAAQVSGQRGQSLSHLLHEALAREVLCNGPDGPARADRPLAPLQDTLRPDFLRARSWPELQGRLMLKGYQLHECAGEVSLQSHPDGVHLCRIDTLGVSHAELVMRFCRPFPSIAGLWKQRPEPIMGHEFPARDLQADG